MTAADSACPACGYNLRGSPILGPAETIACPECGIRSDADARNQSRSYFPMVVTVLLGPPLWAAGGLVAAAIMMFAILPLADTVFRRPPIDLGVLPFLTCLVVTGLLCIRSSSRLAKRMVRDDPPPHDTTQLHPDPAGWFVLLLILQLPLSAVAVVVEFWICYAGLMMAFGTIC